MHDSTRRDFLRGALAAPAAVALAANAGEASGQEAPAATPATATPPPDFPQGTIGGLKVSRMLLGGNLLTHFTHSRDLKYVYELCEHYNTDEKVIETMALAEQNGVNTLSVHTVPRVLATIKRYRRELGGKMQCIVCPTAPVKDDMSEYQKQVRELVDDGIEAIYLWGVHSDKLLADKRVDLIAKAVEVAKEEGVPSGVGAHDLGVVMACEENKIPNDFYIKTFHHHNYPSAPKPEQLAGAYNEVPGYWCRDPQKTIEVMAKVEKPWIAFKIMAAGAIPPEDAFEYALTNGADHLLVGMFDYEIERDAALLKKMVAKVQPNRTRPWRS